MTEDRDDLAERVAALEDAVRDLRTDRVDADTASEPTASGQSSDEPREDSGDERSEHALRAAIAALEANDRALRLLRSMLDSRRPGDADDSVPQPALERVDRAIDHLLTELDEGSLPSDPDARAILTDARQLRDDIDERLRDRPADESASDGESASDDEPGGVEIDVEGELASIKDELDRDDDASEPADGDTNG